MERLTILLPGSLHDEILKQSEREYSSKSELVRRAIVDYLNKKGAISTGENAPVVRLIGVEGRDPHSS